MNKKIQQRKNKLKLILQAIICLAGLLVFTRPAFASAQTQAQEIRTFTKTGILTKSFSPFEKSFQKGMSLTVGDLWGDSKPEVIVGTGPGVPAEVRVFNSDGLRLKSFFPYGHGFKHGVNVAVGDLNGDGLNEIVTAPMAGSPYVRTFDGSGQPIFTPGFYAFDRAMTNGVNIAVGDVTGDKSAEIIVAAGPGVPGHVRVLNRFGDFTGFDVYPFGREHRGGVSLAVGDVNGDGKNELVTAVARYGEPRVKIYTVNQTKDILDYFLAFPKNFTGGLQVATLGMSGNKKKEIVVASSAINEPRIIVYDDSHKKLASFLAFNADFHGGVSLATADVGADGTEGILTAPGTANTEGRADLYKYIDINLTTQRLRYYEAGTLLGEHVISTGKWSTPTPLGTFEIRNHLDTAYSRRYNLYMDWWMAITPDGAFGIHALPFWKLKNGGKLYEGTNHLGTPVSHGCIRQSVEEAKKLYFWADVGTPVIIHK